MGNAPKLKKLKQALRNERELLACAQEVGLLGDLVRLKICYLLCNMPRLSVSQIVELTDASQPLVSHHLAKMRALGLVTAVREGRAIYYSIAHPSTKKVIKALMRKR